MNAIKIIDELRSLGVEIRMDGDQLVLKNGKDRLSEDLLKRLKERKSDIIDFYQSQKKDITLPQAKTPNSGRFFQLSVIQRNIWIDQMRNPKIPYYNVVSGWLVQGDLNMSHLRKAFRTVLEQNEILRTGFTFSKNEILQFISDDVTLNWDFIDLTSSKSSAEEIKKIQQQQLLTPFELKKPPLFRVCLIKEQDKVFRIFLTIHHIISDGWSLRVFFDRVLRNYSSISQGLKAPGAIPSYQYKEYAEHQARQIRNGDFEKSRQFWLELLNQKSFMIKGDRNTRQTTYAGANCSREIDGKLMEGVKAFCQQQNCTTFLFFLSLIKLSLYQLTRNRQIVIEVPVADRTHGEIAEQIGPYLDVIPVVVEVDEQMTFTGFLTLVGEEYLASLNHREYPVNLVVKELKSNNAEYRGLTNVNFTFHNVGMLKDRLITWDGFQIQKIPLQLNNIFNAMNINLFEDSNSNTLSVDYSTELFSEAHIERLFGIFESMLAQSIDTPQIQLYDLVNSHLEKSKGNYLQGFSELDPEQDGDSLYSGELMDLLDAVGEVFEHEGIKPGDNFFNLGGDSLKAITLSAYLSDRGYDCPVDLILETPQLIDLSELLVKKKSEGSPITPISPAAIYPVSYAQRRIWTLANLSEEAKFAYHIPYSWHVRGELQIDLLEAVYKDIIRRHEILRTTFSLEDKEVMQRVQPFNESVFEFEVVQSKRIPHKKIKAFYDKNFDLENGPLIRLCVFRQSNDLHIISLSVHHIIFDGWSLKVFLNEFFTAYKASLGIEEQSAVQLDFQYKDYASWHNNMLETDASDLHRKFWTDTYKERPAVLKLNHLHARSAIQTFGGKTSRTKFGKSRSERIDRIISRYGTSPYTVFTALTNILLHKYSGERNIVTGSPFSNREIPGLEHQIGYYVNTLPVKTAFHIKDSFISLLQRVNNHIKEIAKHQQYPFDLILKDLEIERDSAGHPLFDIVITWLDYNKEFDALTGNLIEIESFKEDYPFSKFDLSFGFGRNSEGYYELHLNYNTDLFGQKFIRRLLSYFLKLTDKLLKSPGIPLDDIDLITKPEQNELESFNQGAVPMLSSFSSVLQSFAEKVAAFPDHTILIEDGCRISLAELNALGNELAEHLTSSQKVLAGEKVGVSMVPSLYSVVSFIGILKSGCVYVPLDPTDPIERSNHIIQDASIKLILVPSDDQIKSGLECPQISIANILKEGLNENRHTQVRPEDPAYVIYTSGTTGKPKGVQISHYALKNFCHYHNELFKIKHTDSSLLYSSLSFDASVWELWPYLLAGACLYPLSQDLKLDISGIIQTLSENKITHCFLPPVILNETINTNSGDHLKNMVLHTGGESVVENTKISEYNIVNNYGLTETTVIATTTWGLKLSEIPVNSIGRPFSHFRIYILDPAGNQLPVGIKGEICVSGPSLTTGYLNDDSLNQEKFTEINGVRVFKTGDFGFWTEDGQIIYCGRADSQIQLNGRRVELNEVTQVIKGHRGVDQALVKHTIHNDQPVLVSYYTTEGETSPTDLKVFARSRLPQAMIPKAFVRMDKLPLTNRGKVDFSQLPSYKEIIESEQMVEDSKSNSSTELFIREAVAEALDLDHVGTTTSFFDLGANSMLVIALHKKIKERYPDIRVIDLFIYHDIESLAAFIEGEKTEKALNIPLTSQNSLTRSSDWAPAQPGSPASISISWHDTQNLGKIASDKQLKISDLLISFYLYGLNILTTGYLASIFIAESDDQVIRHISVDFREIDSEEELYEEVHQKLHTDKTLNYPLDSLEQLVFDKQSAELVAPCILLGNVGPDIEKRLYEKFDITLHLRQVGEDVITGSLTRGRFSESINLTPLHEALERIVHSLSSHAVNL